MVTPRGTRQLKHPILTQCKLPVVRAGDTAVSCPGVTSQPCPCWGSHQAGLATSKELQPPACAGGRVWGPVWGAQVPGWPRPPACAGPVERRWQCQLGQRGGDTGRDRAARRGCSRARGQPSVPHRQCLPGSPCSPSHSPAREALQEGSDSAAPLC